MSKIARIESQKAQAMQEQAEALAEVLTRLTKIEALLKNLVPEKEKKNKADGEPKA